MNQQLNDWIDSHESEIIKNLQLLLQFPSVKTPPFSKQMPFGQGIADSLNFMLEQGNIHGFHTMNLDGYAGFIDLSCGNPELLGVLTHLDVVPVGDGWSMAPFAGTIKADKIYGRGAMDDKGATIASFFALLAIKECQIPLKRNIRLIMGCDEESGMSCIDRYCLTETIPDISFSPDAEYPLVNSEKNIYHAYFESSFASDIRISCGERVNIVPSLATAVVPFSTAVINQFVMGSMNESGYEYQVSPLAKDHSQIDVFGSSAHSSHPENGKNALQGLIYLLSLLPLEKEEDAKRIHSLYNIFGLTYDGRQLGLDCTDASGSLTLNLGVMNWTSEGLEMQLDIRAPLSVTREDIENTLLPRLQTVGILSGSKTKFVDGLFVPEDSELVSNLLTVYREFTDDYTPPAKIGGGTYARKLPNAVAFGIELPDRPNVMHMPDEYIDIQDLILDTKILANAMLSLAGK